MYLVWKPSDAQSTFLDDISNTEHWLAQNSRHLNENKAECTVFGDTVSNGLATCHTVGI